MGRTDKLETLLTNEVPLTGGDCLQIRGFTLFPTQKRIFFGPWSGDTRLLSVFLHTYFIACFGRAIHVAQRFHNYPRCEVQIRIQCHRFITNRDSNVVSHSYSGLCTPTNPIPASSSTFLSTVFFTCTSKEMFLASTLDEYWISFQWPFSANIYSASQYLSHLLSGLEAFAPSPHHPFVRGHYNPDRYLHDHGVEARVCQ